MSTAQVLQLCKTQAASMKEARFIPQHERGMNTVIANMFCFFIYNFRALLVWMKIQKSKIVTQKERMANRPLEVWGKKCGARILWGTRMWSANSMAICPLDLDIFWCASENKSSGYMEGQWAH